MAKITLYLDGFADKTMEEIVDLLKDELAEEIEDAVKRGIDRETATHDVVDYYLNTHNFKKTLEY